MAQQQRRDPEQRPSPEALLETARRENSQAGRLAIFVGAAPGVGKTYEMLVQSASCGRLEGRRRRRGRRGGDTWPGRDRRLLTKGLRSSRASGLEQRNQILEPKWTSTTLCAPTRKLALVDELAHTNAGPGSRHPKRYSMSRSFVRGIDVYTTLNIQHVESLNDIVARITRIQVRETVRGLHLHRSGGRPSKLVDLTPDDLIRRLKDGKVYLAGHRGTRDPQLFHAWQPDRAARAGAPGSPRSASMRRCAITCRPMRSPDRRPPGERVLVCASPKTRRRGSMSYTKRLADRLHAPWTAISIETRRSLQLNDEQRDRLADTLRLAEAMGGEALTIPGAGRRIAEDVVGSPATTSPRSSLASRRAPGGLN